MDACVSAVGDGVGRREGDCAHSLRVRERVGKGEGGEKGRQRWQKKQKRIGSGI